MGNLAPGLAGAVITSLELRVRLREARGSCGMFQCSYTENSLGLRKYSMPDTLASVRKAPDNNAFGFKTERL